MTDHPLRTELYERVQEDASIFDFLHEVSLDGIWYLDVTAPNRMWASRRFEETLGIEPGAASSVTDWWERSVHPEDREELWSAFVGHLAHPERPLDHVARYCRTDGAVVWVRIRGMAMRDESGEVTRVLGAHTDVTELKRAEQRMALLNDDFVRIASHDLGHHVRGISFGVELLAEAFGGPLPQAAEEQLERLRTKVSAAATLLRRIGQVGAVSRTPEWRLVPLGDLVRCAVEGRDDTVSASGAVVEWAPDLPAIECDPVLMQTVLMNLIVNAVTHNDQAVPRVTIRAEQGESTVIRVDDNGPGIPPEERAAVFEPFRSGAPDGSGLGLTICRQIVELHGGRLSVEDTAEGGARFVIRLP
ncbi:MAG: PAS domain-containing sensor histidine kinase [Actinomycetota bacterium]|nr:PAS domain-containing sensor histidine kinase [Actinomycetota bacterium]